MSRNFHSVRESSNNEIVLSLVSCQNLILTEDECLKAQLLNVRNPSEIRQKSGLLKAMLYGTMGFPKALVLVFPRHKGHALKKNSFCFYR